MKLRVVAVFGSVIFHTSLVASATDNGRYHAGAVDAKGVRHQGRDVDWTQDVIYSVRPNYPLSERALHHTGSVLLQLNLDLRTGRVTKVIVLKSTGFSKLDQSIVDTFRQWRWKPGKWREIEVPVTFTLTAM